MIHVLMVESEPRNLIGAKTYLEKEGEISLETARNTEEGLKKLRSSKFSIIISAYELQGQDGAAFLRAAKRICPDTPMILYSMKCREERLITFLMMETKNIGAEFLLVRGETDSARFSQLLEHIRAESEKKSRDDRTDHRNNVLLAIKNIGLIPTENTEIGGVISAICSAITESGAYGHAWIVLTSENGRVTGYAQSGLDNDFEMIRTSLDKGELPDCIQNALQHGGIIASRDPLSSCPECPLSPAYRGLGAMTLALRHGERVYGAISVSLASELIVDEAEQDLFEETGGASTSIINRMDVDRERIRTRKQVSAQQQLGRKLAEAETLEEVIRYVVESSVSASDMDCGALYLVDETTGGFNLAASRGLSENYTSRYSFYPPESELAASIKNKKITYSWFGSVEMHMLGISDDVDEGLKAAALVPIIYRDRVIGSLHVASHTRDDVPQVCRDAFETIAAQAANAIIRIHAEKINPSIELLRDVNRIARTARGAPDLAEKVCRRISSGPGSSGAMVALLENDVPVLSSHFGGDGIFEETLSGLNNGLIPQEAEESISSGEPVKRVKEDGSVVYTAMKGIGKGRKVILSVSARTRLDLEAEAPEVFGEIRDELAYAFASCLTKDELESTSENLRLRDELLGVEKILKEKSESLMPSLFCAIGTDGKILRANTLFSMTTGKSQEEIRGLSFNTFFPEEYSDGIKRHFQNISEKSGGEHKVSFSVPMISAGGEELPVEWTCTVVRSPSGTAPQILCSGRDLSENKKAEEEYNEVLARYTGTISSVDEGIVVSNLSGAVLSINPAAEEMTGWTPEDAEGVPVGEVIRLIDEETGEVLTLSDDEKREGLVCSKKGVMRQAKVAYNTVKDIKGSIIGYLTVIRDLSVKKEATESKSRLEAIFETAGPVVLTDLKGRIEFLNRDAEMITGRSAADMAGVDAGVCMPEYKRKDIENILLNASKSNKTGSFRSYLLSENGREIPVMVRGAPLFDQKGEPRGAAISFLDLSGEIIEKERAEEIQRKFTLLRNVARSTCGQEGREEIALSICRILVSPGWFDDAWIVLGEDGEYEKVIQNDASGSMPGLSADPQTPCTRRALEFNGPILTVHGSGICDECPLSGHHTGGSTITIQLSFKGENYGILGVSGRDEMIRGRETRELVSEISEMISHAFSSIASERDLERIAMQASAQHRLAERLANAPTVKKVVAAILDAALEASDGIAGAMYMYAQERDAFTLYDALPGEIILQSLDELPADSEPGQSLLSGEPILIKNVPDSDSRLLSDECPLCIAIPVVHMNRLSGSLIIGLDIESKPEEQLVRILESIASFGASTIHRMRTEQSEPVREAARDINRILKTNDRSGELAGMISRRLCETPGIMGASVSIAGEAEEARAGCGDLPEEAADEDGEIITRTISSSGRNLGSLTLYMDHEHASNPEVSGELDLICGEISYALQSATDTMEKESTISRVTNNLKELESELQKLERAEGLSQLLSAEINPDRTIRKANESLTSLCGLDTGDINGLKFEDLFVSEDGREDVIGCLSGISESARSGGTTTFEAAMPVSGGESRWIEWNCAMLDESSVIICSGRDITSSKQADEKAGEIFAGYMGTLSAVTDGVIISDRNDRIVVINRPAELITGWSAREANGKELAEVLHAIDENSGEAAEKAGPEGMECIIRGEDGAEHFVEISTHEARDETGKIHGYVTVVRDVSGRRFVKDGSLKMDAIIGAAGTVAITDKSGIVTDLTGDTTILAGIKRDDWIGREIRELFLSERPDEIDALLHRTAEGGKAVSLETRIAVHGGEPKWFRIRASPSLDMEGEITGFAIGFTDISGEVSEREKTERIERNLSLLKRAKDIAGESTNTRAILDAVCDLVASGMRYDQAVGILSREGEVLYVTGNRVSEDLGEEIPGCMARAFQFGGSIVTSSPSPACEDCPFSGIHEGSDVLAIRLEHGGRRFGVIAVSGSKGVWEVSEEQETVNDIAGIISLAVSGLEAEEKHISSSRVASSQKELAERLSAINSPLKAAAAVTKVVTGPLEMDCGMVYLYDKHTEVFRCAACISSADDFQPIDEINAGSEVGKLIMSGRRSCFGDESEGEEIKNMIFGPYAGNLKSCSIVPMIYRTSMIGVLIIGSEDPATAIGPICDTLESISSYSASSIHRIRAEQAGELIRAGERIGRISGKNELPEDIVSSACAILSETGMISEAAYMPDTPAGEDETPSGTGVLKFILEAEGIMYGSLVIIPEDEYLDNPEIEDLLKIIARDIADLLHFSRVTGEMEVIVRDLKDRTAALDSEKSRLETTGNIVSSFLAELDTGGRIIRINNRLGDAIGASTDDLMGRDFAGVFEQGDDTGIIRDMLQRIATGATDTGEGMFNSSFRSGDGMIHSVEWTCSSVKDNTGIISGILCSGEDLSEQIEVNDRLSVLSSRLTGILESLDDAVILTDDKGMIISMNAIAEEMTGLSYADGAGRIFDDYIQLMNETGSQTIDLTLDVHDVPGVLTGGDGTEHCVRTTARTIRRDDGAVSARVIVIRDITPEIKTGEEIKKIEAVLKSSGEPIAEISGEGKITGWNEFAEEETGYSTQEVLGLYLFDLVPEEIRDEAREGILDLLSFEKEGNIDTIIAYSDGGAVNVEIILSPLYDSEGAMTGATARWKNITGEKIEKRRLYRTNKILETLVAIQGASIGGHTSPGDFCEECCNALTETMGARTAVISLSGDEYGNTYYSGPIEWSSAIRERLDSDEIPEFIEIAMEHPGIVDLDDVLSASKYEEINMIFRGKRVLAVRLEDHGEILGYLFVSVMKTDMFPDDHDWFERVADAISSGISRISAVKVAAEEGAGFQGPAVGTEDIHEPAEIPVPELHAPVYDELNQEISTLLSVIDKPVIIVDGTGEIINHSMPTEEMYAGITVNDTFPENLPELFPGYEEVITDSIASVIPDGACTVKTQAISPDNENIDYILDFRGISGNRCLVVVEKETEQPIEDIQEDFDDLISATEDYLRSIDADLGEEGVSLTEGEPDQSIEELILPVLSVFGEYAAIISEEGDIIRANRTLAGLGEELGLDIEGANIDSIVDQSSGRSITALINQPLGEETDETAEESLSILSPDGTYKEADIRISALPDGRTHLFVAGYTREAEEAAVEEKTEPETEYIDVPGTAVAVIDDEGRLIMINSAMEEITGVAIELPSEGKYTIHELMDPSKSAIISEYIRMLDENPGAPPMIRNFQFEDANGNTVECDIAISRDRKKGRTILSFNDISEYARSIRKLEEELRQMKDASPTGNIEAVGIRCKDKFIYLNSTGLKFFGVKSLIELSHKPIIEYVHPDYREESMERTRMSYIEKKPTSFAYMEFIRDDGTVVHGETATVPLYYGVEPASLVVIKNMGIAGNPETKE